MAFQLIIITYNVIHQQTLPNFVDLRKDFAIVQSEKQRYILKVITMT